MFAYFDKAAKYVKPPKSKGAYNLKEWLILLDLLNERVAEGITSDPHDFSYGTIVTIEASAWRPQPATVATLPNRR